MSLDAREGARGSSPLGPGVLALIVGASGVGKDALIAGARSILADDSRFVFPERTITRPPHGSEKHIPISDAEFAKAAQDGQFALTWEAHGLSYAVPAGIDEMIGRGQTVIVNSSRAITGAARQRYAQVHLVLIECPLAVRAERLAQRGREPAESVQARLMRKVSDFDPGEADVRIDNSGTLADGVAALVAALQSFPAGPKAQS